MPDRRGCSPQRPVDRLVTTPQTVQSFTHASSTGWPGRSIRSRCYACGTILDGSTVEPEGDRQSDMNRQTVHADDLAPGRGNFADIGGDVFSVAWANSMRFVLGWADSEPTGPDGDAAGHSVARWVLAERREVRGPEFARAIDVVVLARGSLERPGEGAVANTGRFVIADGHAGDGLVSTFLAYEPDGTLLLSERFGANAGHLTISGDGRHAVVETMHNPADPTRSNRLIAYDLDRRTKLWDIPRRTNVRQVGIDTYHGAVVCRTRAGRLATVQLLTGEADENWDPIGTADNLLVEKVPDQVVGDPFDEMEVLEAGVRWKLATVSEARALRMLARSERLVPAFFGYPRRQARCLYLQGKILEHLGRPDEAGRAYLCGLDLNPGLGVRRRLAALGVPAPAKPRPERTVPTPTDPRPYATTTCPSCDTEVAPLPKAKCRCRACGNPIWVRGAPDGQRHLLRFDQLEAHQARWDRSYEEREQARYRQRLERRAGR